MRNCIFLLFIILTINGCRSYEDYFKSLEIEGVVISKFKYSAREYPVIVVENDNNTDTIHFNANFGLWNHLIKGDSIIKDKGSLRTLVVRNGQKEYFDYY